MPTYYKTSFVFPDVGLQMAVHDTLSNSSISYASPLSSSIHNESTEIDMDWHMNWYDSSHHNVSHKDFIEYKIAEFMENNYRYLVCAVGIPGNLACILTLAYIRPKLASYMFMMALAIGDLTAIALKVFYRIRNLNEMELGDRFCQLIFMFGNTSQMYPNWILVALTTERFIAVWFPFNFKTTCTRKNALVAIVVILLFLIAANLQYLFTYEELPGSHHCEPKENYKNFIQFAWYWIDGALYAIIPIILILVLNSMILYGINRTQTNHSSHRQQISHEATKMLLPTSITFVLLVMPNCVFFIIRGYWNYKGSPLGIAQHHLLYHIVFLLSDLNHAVNFYLYCLSGRAFREQIVDLLCFRKRKPRAMTRSSRSRNGTAA
jgi:gastrin-releasing peptide receptor